MGYSLTCPIEASLKVSAQNQEVFMAPVCGIVGVMDSTLYGVRAHKIPLRMKLNTDFNLVTWLRIVMFADLNASEF